MTYASFDDRCTRLQLRQFVYVCAFVLNQLSLPLGKVCPARTGHSGAEPVEFKL